ncbi:hypothetical protein Hypma_004576 [Hypsizygus marmoreus]|uniref:Uncharacterized protein n=1 Tax=Hypsizygus marmoreus TaxID=39966 RepID=A0A369K301_HYPMA|nr:hypothetical protein Hypma_004576 [Hypsizygus marmoreus]
MATSEFLSMLIKGNMALLSIIANILLLGLGYHAWLHFQYNTSQEKQEDHTPETKAAGMDIPDSRTTFGNAHAELDEVFDMVEKRLAAAKTTIDDLQKMHAALSEDTCDRVIRTERCLQNLDSVERRATRMPGLMKGMLRGIGGSIAESVQGMREVISALENGGMELEAE